MKVELTALLPVRTQIKGFDASGSLLQRQITGEYKTLSTVNAKLDQNSKATLELEVRGVVGQNILMEFNVEGCDASGVEWEGRIRKDFKLMLIRPNQPPPVREVRIDLKRKVSAIRFSMEESLIEKLTSFPKGNFVLDDIDELLNCLRSGLPSASYSMIGKVFDGLLKLKGNYEGWWNTEWDEKPLGALINIAEVKKRLTDTIGSQGFRRLNASGVVMRNLGAHQNFEKVSIDEALASTRFLFDFIERWLSLN